MDLLEPDFSQIRPTFAQAREMCEQVSLELRPLLDFRLISVLTQLRETHANGGALFASFHVETSEAFDWFASRQRLVEFGILRKLFDRNEVRSALPELKIEALRPDDPALVVHALGEYGPVNSTLAAYGIGEDFEIASSGYEGEFQSTSSFFLMENWRRDSMPAAVTRELKGMGGLRKSARLRSVKHSWSAAFRGLYYSTHSPWTHGLAYQ